MTSINLISYLFEGRYIHCHRCNTTQYISVICKNCGCCINCCTCKENKRVKNKK